MRSAEALRSTLSWRFGPHPQSYHVGEAVGLVNTAAITPKTSLPAPASIRLTPKSANITIALALLAQTPATHRCPRLLFGSRYILPPMRRHRCLPTPPDCGCGSVFAPQNAILEGAGTEKRVMLSSATGTYRWGRYGNLGPRLEVLLGMASGALPKGRGQHRSWSLRAELTVFAKPTSTNLSDHPVRRLKVRKRARIVLSYATDHDHEGRQVHRQHCTRGAKKLVALQFQRNWLDGRRLTRKID